MSIRFYDDFSDFIKALNKHEVDYMVVGGFAVIIHGYNRTTGDLDIWVRQSKENYAKLIAAFKTFGMPLNALGEEDFLNNTKDVYTFGRVPVCIEILTAVKGLTFEESFPLSSKLPIDGVPLNVIDVRDLIKAKKASGRLQDKLDIEKLSDKKK